MDKTIKIPDLNNLKIWKTDVWPFFRNAIGAIIPVATSSLAHFKAQEVSDRRPRIEKVHCSST
jgi:hypothetical protein